MDDETVKIALGLAQERNDLLAENRRLRKALGRACNEGWEDGAAAMEHYLRLAAEYDKQETEPHG